MLVSGSSPAATLPGPAAGSPSPGVPPSSDFASVGEHRHQRGRRSPPGRRRGTRLACAQVKTRPRVLLDLLRACPSPAVGRWGAFYTLCSTTGSVRERERNRRGLVRRLTHHLRASAGFPGRHSRACPDRNSLAAVAFAASIAARSQPPSPAPPARCAGHAEREQDQRDARPVTSPTVHAGRTSEQGTQGSGLGEDGLRIAGIA